ncbi:hypothetical protein HZD82_22850, partial [Pantoea agglomerans]|nr:hypothetical protein [Pantoea agglomerans]
MQIESFQQRRQRRRKRIINRHLTCRQLGPGKTFCAHAPGAVEPLQSAIKYFREEFEAGMAPQV